MQQKTSQELAKYYRQECDAIIRQMMRVLYRAQRKVDDDAYRKALAKL